MWYGQLVIGPPGSGKSTYCNGMQQMLRALHRPHAVINLDPANDDLPYECSIALQELLPHSSAMQLFSLGPNGALIYCIEHLLENLDWLEEKLQGFKGHYLLFDCPGQVEVYTHNDAMRRIVEKLQRDLDVRLTAVHVVDSTLCTDGFKYISALLVSLSGQLLLELPHVNVLTKIDLLRHHRRQLRFRLEYFAEAQDLQELMRAMEIEEAMPPKMKDLTALLCELIEDYNLVSFHLLDIQDKHSVLRLLKAIDLANGYSLGHLAADLSLFHLTLDNTEDSADVLDTIQERYVGSDSSEDEKVEGAEEAGREQANEEEEEGQRATGGEADKVGALDKTKDRETKKGSDARASNTEIAGGAAGDAEGQGSGSSSSTENHNGNRTSSSNRIGCSQRFHGCSSAVSSSSSCSAGHCSSNSDKADGSPGISTGRNTADKNTSNSSEVACHSSPRNSSSTGSTAAAACAAKATTAGAG